MVTAVFLAFQDYTMLMGIHESEIEAKGQIERITTVAGGSEVIRLLLDDSECDMLASFFRRWKRMRPKSGGSLPPEGGPISEVSHVGENLEGS